MITGSKVGAAKLRVFDPVTLESFAESEIDVRRVDAASVRAVSGSDGIACRGCPQMIGEELNGVERIGVERIIDRAGTKVRAFDEGVQLRVAGTEMAREPAIWDCFVHDVPANADELTYEVVAGGKIFTAKLATRDLADDKLPACPAINVD